VINTTTGTLRIQSTNPCLDWLEYATNEPQVTRVTQDF
jgi:hypothetical protein